MSKLARFLKVAAIGGEAPSMGSVTGTEQMVGSMCEMLQIKLNAVLCDRPQLIVLPETCDIPAAFTPAEKLSYVRGRADTILNFLRDIAAKNRSYLAYPTIRIGADGSPRNSTYFLSPQGNILGIYDKNKLTVGEVEELGMRCGEEPLVLDCALGRVGFVTCFDLNFSSLRARYAAKKPELLLFSSAFHGGALQTQWAMENRAYFISAVERLPCGVIAPTGQLLASSTNYFESLVSTVNLDYAVLHLDFNLPKLQRAKKKYGEGLRIQDPGLLGAVLLTAESDELTIPAVLEEFELETLDEYLNRAEALQKKTLNRHETQR